MAKPLRTRAEWQEIHTSAVCFGSIKLAAEAHGVSPSAAYQRAHREKWLVGTPASVQEARAHRIEKAKSAGVILSDGVRATPGADILDSELRRMGQQTRLALAQSLIHGSAQAKKTKHPLAKARSIRDLASAAATVHPEQFGAGAGVGGAGDGGQRITIALTQVFGIVRGKAALGAAVEVESEPPAKLVEVEGAPVLPPSGQS